MNFILTFLSLNISLHNRKQWAVHIVSGEQCLYTPGCVVSPSPLALYQTLLSPSFHLCFSFSFSFLSHSSISVLSLFLYFSFCISLSLSLFPPPTPLPPPVLWLCFLWHKLSWVSCSSPLAWRGYPGADCDYCNKQQPVLPARHRFGQLPNSRSFPAILWSRCGLKVHWVSESRCLNGNWER